jgi:diaminopimelate decarboxylase
MTVDSSEEVIRIKNIYPEAELILRIAVLETDAPNPMGKKFGAP